MEAAIDFAVKKADDQLAAIQAFVEGNDVFVALPTGFGKSYCFGPLPLVFDHMRDTEGSIALIATDSVDDGATGEVPSPSHCKAPSLSQHMCAHVSARLQLVANTHLN